MPKPEKTGIKPKQARAVAALMTARTLEQAATDAGVGLRTLYNWLQRDTNFRAAVLDTKARVIDSAERRLITGQEKALDTLEAILDNVAAPVNVRRQAANDWLSLALKYHDINNLSQRLAALEATINGNE